MTELLNHISDAAGGGAGYSYRHLIWAPLRNGREVVEGSGESARMRSRIHSAVIVTGGNFEGLCPPKKSRINRRKGCREG